MSSYDAQTIIREDRVPSQSQIAVFMLLPHEECPTTQDQTLRGWQEQYLTGTQTYTLRPEPRIGPPSCIEDPVSYNHPYLRVFVHTLRRTEKDSYDELSNDQKETLRRVYDTTRHLYREHPTIQSPPSEWDKAHSAACQDAFSKATEKYKGELSELALNPMTRTVTQFVDVVTRSPLERAPTFNLHEILPQDLSDEDGLVITGVNLSQAAIAAQTDRVTISDLVVRDADGNYGWRDDGTIG